MAGLGVLILFLFFLAFGVPLILLIIGFSRWKNGDHRAAKVFFIFGTVWLIIGGGSCLSMLYGA